MMLLGSHFLSVRASAAVDHWAYHRRVGGGTRLCRPPLARVGLPPLELVGSGNQCSDCAGNYSFSWTGMMCQDQLWVNSGVELSREKVGVVRRFSGEDWGGGGGV